MKKILITGKDSYIGTSFERWILKEPDKYIVDTIDMKDDSWREKDFSGYDVVFHVAGIAHIKERKNERELYFKVNRDLTYETAKKAKKDGVGQFIFLSSMSVYGIETGVISKETPLRPNSAYGKSKMEGEKLVDTLATEKFKISILRPPMVYGKGCKGNYSRLSRLALKSPIFPEIENKRSMIYIDNLSEFVKQIIDNHKEGLFFPQNTEYVNTSEMVSLIAEAHGKKIRMTKLFNSLIKLINISVVKKVFGDLIYEKTITGYQGSYIIYGFKESINMTERSM